MATAAPPRLRLGPADHGRPTTIDELLDADEEPGYRYELARGVLEVTEVPGDPHGDIVFYFFQALAFYHRDHPGVIRRYGGSGEFRLWMIGMATGRNPDVAVVLAGTPKNVRGRRPPQLAIEVVSSGAEAHQRDYVAKRAEYLAFGLLEYWIVDPFARRITVLLRDGAAWVERAFDDGQIAEGLALPGFQVPVAEVWPAEADEA